MHGPRICVCPSLLCPSLTYSRSINQLGAASMRNQCHFLLVFGESQFSLKSPTYFSLHANLSFLAPPLHNTRSSSPLSSLLFFLLPFPTPTCPFSPFFLQLSDSFAGAWLRSYKETAVAAKCCCVLLTLSFFFFCSLGQASPTPSLTGVSLLSALLSSLCFVSAFFLRSAASEAHSFIKGSFFACTIASTNQASSSQPACSVPTIRPDI